MKKNDMNHRDTEAIENSVPSTQYLVLSVSSVPLWFKIFGSSRGPSSVMPSAAIPLPRTSG